MQHGSSVVTNTTASTDLFMQFSSRSRRLMALIGLVLIGLHSGTPYALDVLREEIMQDGGFSAAQMSALKAASIIGLFFTLPVGYLQDSYSAQPVVLGGGVMMGLGYVVFAATTAESFPLALFSLVAVSFGSGAAFLPSLTTSMACLPHNTGLGVSLVGGGMSLSVTYCNLLFSAFRNARPDSGPEEWRGLVLMLAALTGGTTLVAGLWSYTVLPSEESTAAAAGAAASSDHDAVVAGLGDEDDEDDLRVASPAESLLLGTDAPPADESVPLIASLMILRHRFFWSLFLAYFAGIAGGLLVLTNAAEIWSEFAPSDKDSVGLIFLLFPVCNVTGNVAAGYITDWLQGKGVRRSLFQAAALAVFAGWLAVMGVMNASHSMRLKTVYLLFLITSGLFFGCCFTVFPAIVGEVYGYANFGKYFSYLSFSSSAASLFIPAISSGGHFTVLFFFMAILVTVAALSLAIKPSPWIEPDPLVVRSLADVFPFCPRSSSSRYPGKLDGYHDDAPYL